MSGKRLVVSVDLRELFPGDPKGADDIYPAVRKLLGALRHFEQLAPTETEGWADVDFVDYLFEKPEPDVDAPVVALRPVLDLLERFRRNAYFVISSEGLKPRRSAIVLLAAVMRRLDQNSKHRGVLKRIWPEPSKVEQKLRAALQHAPVRGKVPDFVRP